MPQCVVRSEAVPQLRGCATRDLAPEINIPVFDLEHIISIMSETATPRSPRPSSSAPAPTVLNKHAPTPVEQQRLQLERLLKDPNRPAHIPKAPTEKTLRAPREMMKNVQGSSAGTSSFLASLCSFYSLRLLMTLYVCYPSPVFSLHDCVGTWSGAGSGEFHVYKQSRRREYERLKIMDETSRKVCI